METQMHAFVEHLSGLVRVGPVAREYGMDWDFIVAHASVDGKTAVVKGLKKLTTGFTMEHGRAILDALARIGFQWAHWTRHKHGKVRPVTIDLRKRAAYRPSNGATQWPELMRFARSWTVRLTLRDAQDRDTGSA